MPEHVRPLQTRRERATGACLDHYATKLAQSETTLPTPSKPSCGRKESRCMLAEYLQDWTLAMICLCSTSRRLSCRDETVAQRLRSAAATS